ncbi:hypothetical protein GCM10012275_57360 [Longimycelium tulufanense]|uniref:Exonuclease domain-containing protein n=1 Tax=Longimycelium tulufanense TaxID=907463 RepID=A0A8J3CK33_9PSEU|nr:3'-5' exonuclease [Longimycelium tulufanense]GGM79318.1 hypothetical protein GCM10012275_57360 [Longimycelium tulufanense]
MTAGVSRSVYGPLVLAETVGLRRWQVERAESVGMLPLRGHDRGWLPEQVEEIRALVPEIVERFGAEHPIGAARAAERVRSRLGLDVRGSDVEALAEGGYLAVVEVFVDRKGRRHDLFAPAELDALTVDQVQEVITAREAWMASSVSVDEACERLGWRREDVERVTAERKIPRGRLGRIARADLDALAADAVLCAQVEADRLLTADQVAERLDVMRRHVDIAVEAGWLTPTKVHEKVVGRYRTVDVPLYRAGDVDTLLERPDINWSEVRETPKGERSPLLDLVGGRAATRADVIRAFLRDFGAQHGIEMWGWWVPGPDVWEIDWERIEGGPTKGDVVAAIAANPAVRRHRRCIRLHSAAGAAIRFARAMLEPGRAVILDTETTDLYGAVCEIAVIDASTGKTLLNTLVNPGVPIQPGAYAVHGITDEEVTAPGVPTWPAVYKRVLRVTKGRTILAYHADYDRSVVARDCERYSIRRTRLADPRLWADVMVPRSDHARSRRWLPNGGGHRALGDARQTRHHLLRMTAP